VRASGRPRLLDSIFKSFPLNFLTSFKSNQITYFKNGTSIFFFRFWREKNYSLFLQKNKSIVYFMNLSLSNNIDYRFNELTRVFFHCFS